MADRDIEQIVKEKYGQAALRVSSGGSSCCGLPSRGACDPITSNLYERGTRIYRTEDARELLDREGIDAAAIARMVDGKFMSAFIRAREPRAV